VTGAGNTLTDTFKTARSPAPAPGCLCRPLRTNHDVNALTNPRTNTCATCHRVQALMKEALYLTTELARMNKQIENDLNTQSDNLANWIDENSLAKWFIEHGTDSAAQKALEKIFSAVFKLLKVATGPAGLVADVTVQAFSASGRPSKRNAYLDTPPGLSAEYDKMKARLQQVYMELFVLQPPKLSAISTPDRCAQEACWRAARP